MKKLYIAFFIATLFSAASFAEVTPVDVAKSLGGVAALARACYDSLEIPNKLNEMRPTQEFQQNFNSAFNKAFQDHTVWDAAKGVYTSSISCENESSVADIKEGEKNILVFLSQTSTQPPAQTSQQTSTSTQPSAQYSEDQDVEEEAEIETSQQTSTSTQPPAQTSQQTSTTPATVKVTQFSLLDSTVAFILTLIVAGTPWGIISNTVTFIMLLIVGPIWLIQKKQKQLPLQ